MKAKLFVLLMSAIYYILIGIIALYTWTRPSKVMDEFERENNF